MKTVNSFVCNTLISWTVFCAFNVAHAQRHNPVRRTPRHDEIRTMAKEIIHAKNRRGNSATRPIFKICNDGHLHWYIGGPGIGSESFAMNERLRIEWFWKHLSHQQRGFWKPYTREVDAEIDRFIRMRLTTNADVSQQQQEQSQIRIDNIYLKAVDAYARAKGVLPVETPPDECCGSAAELDVHLRTRVRGVVAIKWIEAGSVWLAVSRTGQEPEYHSYVPGTRVEVSPGALYYYKLVFREGRETRRLLAPKIPMHSRQVLLASH